VSATNDGGRAFPEPGVFDAMRDQVNPVGAYYDAGGMSLRDYFAAKFAHAELLTCGAPGAACDALVEAIKKTGESPEDHMARCAYDFADAMLRAREVRS
jgi:hypothetical protein